MKMNNKRGTVLILTYLVITVLLILGIAFVSRSIVESRIAERQKRAVQAFCIAEAGLERALYDLRVDFENSPGVPSWRDDRIYTSATDPTLCIDLSQGATLSIPQNYPNFYLLPYGTNYDYNVPPIPTLLGGGSFTVELANIPGKDDEIWVRSTGTVEEISKTIQAYIKIEDIAPWRNVIFAGVGAAGAVINGNVDIRGSLLVLGENLAPTDIAVNVSGDGLIGNNYVGIPPSLSSRIPACPTTTFNSELVESLGAKLRIRHGQLGLSGSATVGSPDVPGNAYKETADAVFITDGYTGNQGASAVFSDNGTNNGYDLGDSIHFPSLSDPYRYDPTITYQEYVRNNALVISDPDALTQLANITPDSDFGGDVFGTPLDNGSISMDGNGNMTIDGIIYIDGGDFNMKKQGGNDTITYSGKGSILVTGNVGINVNLFTPPSANSFPTNIMGIMTPNEIVFDAAQIDVMGIFYAETKVTSKKQTDVAGTFASNYFDMGNQVPSIFQVPAVADNLPPGMIGAESIWVIKVIAWQRL